MSSRSSTHAVCVGGPEDGMTVRVGICQPPARTIEFADQPNGMTAVYVRTSKVLGRPAGCGHVGQLTYRFAGYEESVLARGGE